MLPVLLALQVAAAPNDALRYDITLIPSDTGLHLLGEVETTWRLASPDPVGVVLDSSMRVVRVLIDGRPNTRISRTMYGRSDSDVVVPHQKRSGDSITTRIRYHGSLRGGGTLAANRGGARVFFASGSDDGARYWLPVPLELGYERASASFRIQAPLGSRVVAPGTLEKVDTLPYGDATWRYRTDASVPLAALAVATGPYDVTALTPGRCGDGCPLVESWRYAEGKKTDGTFGRAMEMVEVFAAKAGRYPYPRLAYVEAPVESPIAAPGMVFVPQGWAAGDSALALPTARQWFGLAVSPATADDRRLLDGLATYLALLWRDPAGRSAEARAASESEAAKGARALHRVRGEVGDSAFFAGLARFSGDRLHQAAGEADFVRALSAVAGRDVGPMLRKAFARDR
jgi:aminopeptidase N